MSARIRAFNGSLLSNSSNIFGPRTLLIIISMSASARCGSLTLFYSTSDYSYEIWSRIERSKWYSRARFNRPYSCIKLKRGKTTGVLRTLDLTRPSIVWLDYDHELQAYIFRDLEFLIEASPKGSVVIATIEAEAAKFENEKDRVDLMWRTLGRRSGPTCQNPLMTNCWGLMSSLHLSQTCCGTRCGK